MQSNLKSALGLSMRCISQIRHDWLGLSLGFLLLASGLVGSAAASVSVVGGKLPIATGWAGTTAGFGNHQFLLALQSDTAAGKVAAQLVLPGSTTMGTVIPLGHDGQSCCAGGVAFDGTNYLVTWEEDQGIKNSWEPLKVYGQFISAAGAKVGATLDISGAGISVDGQSMLAYGGGKYLMTYTRLINPALGDTSNNRYVAGRIIAPDGTIGSEFRISQGFGNGSSVTFNGANGENFFVVWKEDSLDQEVRGRFVTPAGVPLGEISINASPAPSDNPVAVSFDGSQYMVLWSDQNSIGWDVYAQRVSVANGSLVGGVISVNTEPGSQMATSISFDGSRHLVTWIDMKNDANMNGVCEANEGSCWDVYGQYVGIDGVLVGSKFAISTDPGNQIGGAGCAAGGCMAVVSNGVMMGQGGPAQVGDIFGAFIYPAFDLPYLNAAYTALSFTTLPFDARAIAFDAALDLYTASASNDNTGQVNILKLTAASNYTAASQAYSYPSSAAFVTGLDFQGGQLLVSESDASANSGKISNAATGALIKDLPDFRPSGMDARGPTLVTGRLKSNADFGNIYQVNTDSSLSVLIANLPTRGIAKDAAGDIYLSTRNTDFGTFLGNSIYRFAQADGYLVSSSTRVATLGGGGSTELTFDNAGNLYALYTPNPLAPTSAVIIQIRPPAVMTTTTTSTTTTTTSTSTSTSTSTTTTSTTTTTLPVSGSSMWQIKASMLTARSSGAAGGVIDGKLYVVGGQNGATLLSSLEVYDPTSNTWVAKQAMPTARNSLGAAVMNGKLYVVGGNGVSGQKVTTLEVYDPATDSWTAKTSMPTARSAPSVVAMDGLLYVAGGCLGWCAPTTNVLEVYNPTTDSWTTQASMPSAHALANAVVANKLLYVMGGCCGSTAAQSLVMAQTIDVYNPLTNGWASKATHTVDTAATTAVIGGHIFVAGLTATEEYNPVSDVWTALPIMPTPRSSTAGGVINGKLYVAGGAGSDNLALANLEVFNPGLKMPYESDANTVLIDHFDGATSANILAFSETGAACGSAKATATPNSAFGDGPDGLSQALTLLAPSGQPVGSATYLQYPGGQLLSQANGAIEFWTYLTSYANGIALVSQGPYPGACAGWTFGMNVTAAGQLQAGAWAAFSLNSGATSVPLNRWAHVAATWGSAGAKLYLNGVQVGSDTNTGMPASGYGGSVLLGYSASGLQIDELRVSNVQRTSFATLGNLSAGPGLHQASGNYTWNSATGALAVNVTSSDFACEGPAVGEVINTVTTVSATTMTWTGKDNMTWTRTGGAVGDVVGNWTGSSALTGNSYQLGVAADGSFALSAVIVSCGTGGGSGDGDAKAEAQHWSDGYYVQLRYSDPGQAASAVSVTGIGITGSLALSYNTNVGSWGSGTPESRLSLGTSYPAGLPFNYTFTITDPVTRTELSTVSCFQQQFVSNLAPVGTVTGNPTFSWNGIGDSQAVYGVQVNDASGHWLWANYAVSGNSVVYGGPPLSAGATYGYVVSVQSSSACTDPTSGGGSYVAASFTYGSSSGSDSTAPTVPTGVNAVEASVVTGKVVNVSWGASTDNVGVTGYKVYRNNVLAGQPGGANNNFWPDNSVADGGSYTYAVAACDAANNCSAQSSSVTVVVSGTSTTTTTTSTSSTTSTSTTSSTTTTTLGDATLILTLVPGWNLVGNGGTGTIDAAALNDGNKVTTVWKWLASLSKWAFYAPALTGQQLLDYAASKGYDVLTSIGAGEGFWVNAKIGFSTTVSAPAWVASNSLQPKLDGSSLLLSGWNLIAIGDNKTPSAFNKAIGAEPPAVGVVPINLTTLWAWDALQSGWYFYAPSLEAQGGTKLTDYIATKNYLDFTTNGKVLAPADGFWVNKP